MLARIRSWPTTGLLLLGLFAIACTTVAVTGRKQLNFIPNSEIFAMSATQYGEFLGDHKVVTGTADAEMIQRCGRRIQDAVERYFIKQGNIDALDGYQWEFNLVESDEVNAWCMPGGKVVFYTGILPICQDETGVAVVMGHEVAHAIANHGSERMSQGLLLEMGGVALSKALESQPEKTRQLWMTSFGLGAQVGVMLPFSRTQESEADHLGLVFMAMAGYNPDAAVSFWQRMAENAGPKPPEFLSTHPSDATRIRHIQELLPEARSYYKPAG